MILVVAVLGYGVLSGQLSPGQLLEELLGGVGATRPAATQNTPSADAARRGPTAALGAPGVPSRLDGRVHPGGVPTLVGRG